MSGALRSLRSASCWRIENRFFTEQRILVCASTAAVAYAIGLAWRFGAGGSPKCIDFTSMWVSGSFAGSSDPAQMYDNSAWLASWKGLTGLGDCILVQGHTSYPPTLFFTYPLGLMPYALAFVVWMAATLLLYLAAVYAIVPRSAVIIAALTPYTSPFNVLLGQNGFLTAGLIGLSLVFIERRPWLSGIFLGLLTYKPQFGVLFPLALVASRNWRALISATASSLVIGLAAAVVFGHQTWPFFVDSLLDRDAGLGSDHVELSIQSVLGLLHWMGAGAETSWAAHLAVAATLALTIWLIWAKQISLSWGEPLCVSAQSCSPPTCSPTISASCRSSPPFSSATAYPAVFSRRADRDAPVLGRFLPPGDDCADHLRRPSPAYYSDGSSRAAASIRAQESAQGNFLR